MLTSPIDDTVIKIIMGVVVFLAGLFGVVIVVALLQEKLDPTGIATLIGGILTGLVGSVVLLKQKASKE